MFLRTSLALISLLALGIPCVHAEGHDHAEEAHAMSAPLCEHCHACSEEPCSKPRQVAPASLSSSVDIPVRLVQKISVFNHTVSVPVPTSAPRPPGGLQFLQTVQLLI
jgi:hypothetical protein